MKTRFGVIYIDFEKSIIYLERQLPIKVFYSKIMDIFYDADYMKLVKINKCPLCDSEMIRTQFNGKYFPTMITHQHNECLLSGQRFKYLVWQKKTNLIKRKLT
jgi:hypothetical protein